MCNAGGFTRIRSSSSESTIFAFKTAVRTSNVDASHWNRAAHQTSMRKAEASAPELKLSSSGFRGSRFPQATHLIFFFSPPGPGFLAQTNFEGMNSIPFPFFSASCCSLSSSSGKTSRKASYSCRSDSTSLLMAGSHSSQISETSFGDTIHVCKISSSSFGKTTIFFKLPKTFSSSSASSGSSSTMVRISSSIIRRRCTRFFFSSSL